MTHQYAELEDTVYFWFASNDTSGSGDDGASALADVREAGATASDAPILSPTPGLLTHANYPPGCYEVAVAATAANGFAADTTYGVFCTLTVDSQNPAGFVGSFSTFPVQADIQKISTSATAADNAELDYDGTGYTKTNSTIGTCTTLTGHTAQTGDSFARIGVAGAGLSNIDLPNQTMDITGNLSGSVGSVTGNVGGVAGTITTLDALDTAQDSQHASTQSDIAALNDVAATDIVSAGAITTLTGAVVNVDLVDTTTDVTNQVTADVTAISGTSAAADNLELMYDGTGYTDDTAPASRSQLEAITVTGAAVNVLAIDAPNGFTLTTGSEVNDEDSTHALDGTRHELTDDAGTLDCYYEFDIEGDSFPTSVTIIGVFNGGNDDFNVFANAGTDASPSWEQLGTLEGTNSGVNVSHTFTLFTSQIVTDVSGRVQIRINGTGLSSSSFDVDQIFVSKAVVNKSVGYALGSIWVDTNESNTNTENYVDGVADNPVSTWAAALTLSSQLGLKRFVLAPDSSITLSANSDNYQIVSTGSTIALGGQSISGTKISGGTVTGDDDGSNTQPTVFEGCKLTDSTLGQHILSGCALQGNITLAEAGDYLWDQCASFVASNGTPDVTFPVGNAALSVRHYSGGMEINFMAAGDTMSFEGDGQFKIAATCSGGAVSIRGSIGPITDAAAGAVTLTENARIADDTINAEMVDVLTVDAISEIAQGVPSSTPNLADAVMLMYMALRNKTDVATSGTDTLEIHNDAGTRVCQKLLTDDGSDYSEAKMTSGA